MDTKTFLEQVVTTDAGNFVLCSRNHTIEWNQEFYQWPTEQSKILSRIEFLRSEYDLYFSSHLFSQQDASKSNVLPTRTIQADLDNADLKSIKIDPTILVETSPDRFQAYWILDPKITIEVPALESLSKRVTYSITDADHTGWPVGHRLRIPNTLNFKYNNGPHDISIVSNTGKLYLPEDLELLPQIHQNILAIFDNDFANNPPSIDTGPFELLEKFKSRIPQQVYIDYISKQVAQDRSKALWALMCSLFEAGATREQVFWLAKHSPNNKFAQDLRYNADKQLAKDVQQAEKHVKVKPVDAKSIIDQARIMPQSNTAGGAMYKRRYIAETTIDIMGLSGRFLHATAGLPYFIPNETGRPVALTSHSEHFRAMLNIQYGLNAADPEWKFVHTQILDHAISLPETVIEATLSYYDSIAHTMLVHTGRKEVLRLSPDKPIEVTLNGNNGVLFPWYDMMAPFEPDFSNPHENWGSAVFGDVHSCSNMHPKQALALLKVWFMFSLFRAGVTQRPILALFGQPSCLSQDTIIKINRRRNESSNREYTIKELYIAFHNIPRKGKGKRLWDKSIPTKTLSIKDGVITFRKIHDVIQSGTKETYTVKLSDNKTIRTTLDHRFLTVNGYKTLGELSVGDIVLVRGPRAKANPDIPRSRQYHVRVCARYHPRSSIKDSYRIRRSWAVLEADMNNISYEDYLHIVNHEPQLAKNLVYIEKGNEVHHKNNISTDDRLENLQTLSKLEHNLYHVNMDNFGHLTAARRKIVSIEYYGEEPTYDIIMEDEDAPNFLANDIIVHNSGKSTIPHSVYALLYSKRLKVQGLTNAANFDTTSAKIPIYCIDNLDTYVGWVLDRLAQAIGDMDIIIRKLWTDADIIRHRRQAMICVTAHNPKFTREDVTGRLLLITMSEIKPDNIFEETDHIDNILKNRNRLWGAILNDVLRVLKTPKPVNSTVKWRIQDFASLGEWIAIALDIQDDFNSGLRAILGSQTDTILQQEEILVEAIKSYVLMPDAGEWKNSNALFNALLTSGGIDQNLFKAHYKSGKLLGQKLKTMQSSLAKIACIETTVDPITRVTLWKVTGV